MKLLTAIIYTDQPQINGVHFLKYRNIPESKKEKFLKFAAGFPGARYVNWYEKKTRNYAGRSYFVR